MEKKESNNRSNKASHPLYRTWVMMRQRCNNPNSTSAPWYHDMGIRVCDEWEQDFWAFVQDMGEKPHPSYTLDRMNPNGNYEPSNCRWASPTLQHHNRRENLGRSANKPRGLRVWRKTLEFEGQHLTIKEWAEEFGLNETFLRTRLQQGFTLQEARDIPKHTRRASWLKEKKEGRNRGPSSR